MKFSAVDSARYQKTRQYIEHEIPKLKSNWTIIRNLRTYASLTTIQAQDALTWNKGPQVLPTNLAAGQCGSRAANGCFRRSAPNKLEIAFLTVLQFEGRAPSSLDRTTAGRDVYIIGTTLLHELCHWGNNLNGAIYSGAEAGRDFEIATYGRNTG